MSVKSDGFLFLVEGRCWENIKRSRVNWWRQGTGRMRRRQKKYFSEALERRKMNGMSVRGRLWASQVEAVGKPSVRLIRRWQLSPHPQPHQLPGKPFHPCRLKYQAGRREGASVCVQKERADGPLTFAAINNVVTQLEKTTGSRKRLPWRGEGLRSEEPLKRWRKQSVPCSREYL